MNDELIRFLVTILFGAIAGGTTNAVAVWMLFHPYEPPRVLGRKIGFLQGAVPKNKARLASAMGRTVGTKLLTAEDISQTLAEPEFRAAFDERLSAFVRSVFEERRGSITDLMPPSTVAELRALLLVAGDRLLARLDVWLESEESREQITRWLERVREELHDRPIGDVLTDERQRAFAAAADRWLEEAVEGDAFAQAIRDYVDRGAERVLQPDRTFEQLLPEGLIGAVERAIAGYLPIAIERLGGMLEDPGARAKVEQVLHELLDRFMRDLKFHQRLVAALLITPDTVERVLKAVEKEGAAKISELLQDASVRDAMARGVNSAIQEFLQKPVVSVLGKPGDPSVDSAKETSVRWVLSLARDPQTRAFAVERIQGLMDRAELRTWGDLLRHVPTDRVCDAVITAARSDRAAELSKDALVRTVDWIVTRPIGRIADHAGDDAAERAERAIAEPLWAWIQQQVPTVTSRLDIQQRVEQKILEFPTRQVELLVRGVTERELQLIVQLGYVLGAVIGLVSASIALFF